MPWSFWTKYLLALTRRIARRRGFAPADRLLGIVESTMLTQHASVHVIKAGTRYFLVGVCNAAVSLLAEIRGDEV
jgi:flagellar biogenesis protein FliO